jgi:hypothetical protein
MCELDHKEHTAGFGLFDAQQLSFDRPIKGRKLA